MQRVTSSWPSSPEHSMRSRRVRSARVFRASACESVQLTEEQNAGPLRHLWRNIVALPFITRQVSSYRVVWILDTFPKS